MYSNGTCVVTRAGGAFVPTLNIPLGQDPFKPYDRDAACKRMFRRPSLETVIRSMINTERPSDRKRYNPKELTPIKPIPLMTAAEKKRELNRLYHRLAHHKSGRDDDGYWYTMSATLGAINPRCV